MGALWPKSFCDCPIFVPKCTFPPQTLKPGYGPADLSPVGRSDPSALTFTKRLHETEYMVCIYLYMVCIYALYI